ncbi:MAG: ATPase domain-containing protein [Candidatus Aenigmatarchaeota archaeon]
MDIEKVKTGISGFDEITKGGLPKEQLTLLTGTTGTGKTTLCTQFIYNGAKNFKEPGVYLSFEDPEEHIREGALAFGWDLRALEKARKLAFIRYDPYRISDVMDILESTIREIKARRVVIDSISALGLYVKDRSELRRMIFDIAQTLRRLECTPILVSEMVHGMPGISRYGVEEFVADSVIVLYYERVYSAFVRGVQVWKLRNSPHSETLHPYTITKAGITVFPEEEAFIKLGPPARL